MESFSPLLPLLPMIQIALFAVSGFLLLGALAGFYLKADDISNAANPLAAGGMSKERRRTSRFSSEADFEFTGDSAESSPPPVGVVNLSRGGACLLTARRLTVGQRFLGRLLTPPQSAMRVTARVVWIKPVQEHMLYGVHLESLRPDIG